MGLGLPIATNLEVAISSAYSLAESLGKPSIATEHLLFGLASTTNCVASKILKKYNVTEKKLLKVIESQRGSVSQMKFSGKLDFSPISKSSIEHAFEIAYRQGASCLYTEHLLRSLIGEFSGVVSQILVEEFNVPLDSLIYDVDYAIMNGGKIPEASTGRERQEKAGGEAKKENPEEDINIKLPEVLRDLGIDITERARRGKMDPIIGRDKETSRIIEILCRKTKNNPRPTRKVISLTCEVKNVSVLPAVCSSGGSCSLSRFFL